MRVAVPRAEGGERDSAKRLRETYPVIAAAGFLLRPNSLTFTGVRVPHVNGAMWLEVLDSRAWLIAGVWACETHLPGRMQHIRLLTQEAPPSTEFYCSPAMDKSLGYE